MSHAFRDRHDAGRQLADLLVVRTAADIVLASGPAGGVPVAYQVAHRLHTALDVLLVRDLVVPGPPSVAVGVVASGGVRVLDGAAIAVHGVADAVVEELTQRERISLLARERTYRGHNTPLEVRSRRVILADDGAAPAGFLASCVSALREQAPSSIVLALPIAARQVHAMLREIVDELVVVHVVESPLQVAGYYQEYLPVSHTEVRALLGLAQAEAQSRELAGNDATHEQQLTVPLH
jgi:putative phosphoribosyl transferase